MTVQREPSPCTQDNLSLFGCLHYRPLYHNSGPATWAGEQHEFKDDILIESSY